MKNNVLLFVIVVAAQCGCAASTTSFSSNDGPTGRSVSESCSSQCITKVDAANGQEKCMEFSQGMASACGKYQNEGVPKGSFTDKP